MKLIRNFNSFISESNKEIIIPNNNRDLRLLIANEIQKYGPNCNLNHIDVSNVNNMDFLFNNSPFNGDISKWNVSNVTSMAFMFKNSKFNGNISNWNTSNVSNMAFMFKKSEFNQDISNWNISNVTDMNGTFDFSKIEKNNMPYLLNGSYYIFFEDKDYYLLKEKESLKKINASKIKELIFLPKNVIDMMDIHIDNDEYYYIQYKGAHFKCDGMDGVYEFINNWKL